MLSRKIGWQFFVVCYAITAFALWFSTWYSIHIYKDNYLKTTIHAVSIQAKLLEREFSPAIADTATSANIDLLCKQLGETIDARLTVILPNGKVVGDSKTEPQSMENHGGRPEIGQAVQGKANHEIRYSSTLKQDMLYFAVPLYNNKSVTGVLRLSVTLGAIKEQERVFYHRLTIVSVILFIILSLVIGLFTALLVKPIRQMKSGTQRFARGDFSCSIPVPKNEELGELATTLNSMALSLDDRIKTITRQRNELTAILLSLNEGVIAVDNNERIISINPAAERILGVTESSAKGNWLHEIVRNSGLQKFLLSTLSSNNRIESTFTLSNNDGEIHIQAYGTKLSDSDNNPNGAVLVLNDITNIRKLENMRKDFVANVSHELRTPLTSIKGFIETIRDGTYSLPEEVKRFLEIISSKTDNLCSIVDDILTLSSIERDQECREIGFAKHTLKSVLQDAVDTCHWKAVKKSIQINLDCSSGIVVNINAPLIEQAVVNLLDNAIKYSNENTTISVSVVSDENNTTISVNDQGVGIADEHLGRVFERFYRVDKARSRKLGGTGLGLSIVKNIATAHNGTVAVNSIIGKGSTFEIRLPIQNS